MKVIGYVDENHLFEAYVGSCHIDRDDGGHIRMRATRKGVHNISELNEQELLALGGAIQKLANAMEKAQTANGIHIKRVNIQINNNWSDLYRTEESFCVHFYGRAYDAKKQPLGQALYFPSPREHTDFYQDNRPVADSCIEMIRNLLLQ